MNDPTLDTGLFRLRGNLPSAKHVPVEVDTRWSFFQATGITPDTQRALEAFYDQTDLSYSVCGIVGVPHPAHCF